MQKVVESITQVLHIIRFPVPDMVDAIQGSLRALLGMQKDKAGIFEGAPMTIQMLVRPHDPQRPGLRQPGRGDA